MTTEETKIPIAHNLSTHIAWRRSVLVRFGQFVAWLNQHGLLSPVIEQRLRQIEQKIRSKKVTVAFVAEYSRGKSELINAIFFASYGRRMIPASAGRTTMCPTELAWDKSLAPSLRLLPVETRLQERSLLDWRNDAQAWEVIALDPDDPDRLIAAFEKVSEAINVSVDRARTLGFWFDNAPENNPLIGIDGLVQVPKWRHALVNIAHPLLKQGLVVIDTPGLNAVGAEPELTLSLIPQADAVVFVLGADTGVSKSDLAIWNDHLAPVDTDQASRFVVLNKIDMLWDELSTPVQIQSVIDRQEIRSAQTLGLPRERVISVSAQRGLVAKVSGDEAMLLASQLPLLEHALSKGILGQQKNILQSGVVSGLDDLRRDISQILKTRRSEVTDQLIELKSLRGKNSSVIKHLRQRLGSQQEDFNLSAKRIQGVRSMYSKLWTDLLMVLGSEGLRQDLDHLSQALRRPALMLNPRQAYAETFERLNARLSRLHALTSQMHDMFDSNFKALNVEFGFSLQAPKQLQVDHYQYDLGTVERSHIQYLGLGNQFRLSRSQFTQGLVRALSERIEPVFESALGEVQLWSEVATAQMDSQWRERRRAYNERVQAIAKIQDAAGSLDHRIQELELQKQHEEAIDTQLSQITANWFPPDQAEAPLIASESIRA